LARAITGVCLSVYVYPLASVFELFIDFEFTTVLVFDSKLTSVPVVSEIDERFALEK